MSQRGVQQPLDLVAVLSNNCHIVLVLLQIRSRRALAENPRTPPTQEPMKLVKIS